MNMVSVETSSSEICSLRLRIFRIRYFLIPLRHLPILDHRVMCNKKFASREHALKPSVVLFHALKSLRVYDFNKTVNFTNGIEKSEGMSFCKI